MQATVRGFDLGFQEIECLQFLFNCFSAMLGQFRQAGFKLQTSTANRSAPAISTL
jgi:hypothetical protein